MSIHANIDDVHLHAMKFRQRIDGSSLSEEVQHHLPRHLAWISAYPFGSNSMVGGKNINCLLQRPSKIFLSNGHHLRGNILKHAKASRRLRQRIQMRTRTLKSQLARRLYSRDNLGDNRLTCCIHPTFFVCCWIRSSSKGWRRGGQLKAFSKMEGFRISA